MEPSECPIRPTPLPGANGPRGTQPWGQGKSELHHFIPPKSAVTPTIAGTHRQMLSLLPSSQYVTFKSNPLEKSSNFGNNDPLTMNFHFIPCILTTSTFVILV